jgi:tetratricopeptide (TPR) repeat protein/mono/diheme cytochrome c family protein
MVRLRPLVCSVIVVVLHTWGTAPDAAAQPAPGADQPVTFSQQIAPILFARCAVCHRPGGSAPFALLTYQEARSRAAQLAAVTSSRVMPPWQPEPGHGEFRDSRRLSDAEIQLVQRWVAQGAAEGNPADLPPIPQWTSDWTLGEPDLVLTMSPYELRADGPDMFRNVVVPAGFSGTKYVRAWEFRPGNARVVHHATMQMDTTGLSRRLDERDAAEGYEGVVALTARAPDGFFLDWAPGHRPATAVEGTAWPLDGSSDLVLMLHLRPSGKPESVQASVGFYFSDKPPSRLPVMMRLTRQDLDIAAGDRRYEVADSYTLPVDVSVYTVQPHAHYLGRRLQGVARLPSGEVLPLIQIQDWNFDWQDVYHYRDPVRLPAGTRVEMSYLYDNSRDNPRNPHTPPRRVTYGQQTDDEMAELWFQVVTGNETDRARLVADLRAKVRREEIKGRRMMLIRDPGNFALRDDLLLMLTEDGRLMEAAEEARRSLALQPSSAAAHYNLGVALLAVERGDQAREYFERALQLDADHVMARYSLALVLDVRERTQAIEHLRRALQLRPDWPAADTALAWHLARGSQQERSEALALAQRAVDATSGRDLAALDVLATVQAASSRFGEAAATIRRALVLVPRDADEQARSLRRRLEEYERAAKR